MRGRLQLYRYASDRRPDEGLRIGVARNTPEGIAEDEWSSRGYFDLYLPILAPSETLEAQLHKGEIDWENFTRRYLTDMERSECRQMIDLLAAMASSTAISLGCDCEDEEHCHRSLLRCLVEKRGTIQPPRVVDPRTLPPAQGYSSPACFANWDDLE